MPPRSQLRYRSVEALRGDCPAIVDARAVITSLRHALTPVLILGDSGTGKSFIAQLFHPLNADPKLPDELFFLLDCTSLPADALLLELFGCVAGARSPDSPAYPGLLQRLVGGTLVLDDVAALPLEVQARLNSAVETRRFRPFGATEDINVNVRFIATAGPDLEQRRDDGRFRPDLYFRLAEAVIRLPPLRHRDRDVHHLARALVHRFHLELDRDPDRMPALATDALELLHAQPWPGNVRELEQVLRLTVRLLGRKTLITADMLRPRLMEVPAVAPDEPLPAKPPKRPLSPRALERQALKRLAPAPGPSLGERILELLQELGPTRRQVLEEKLGTKERTLNYWLNPYVEAGRVLSRRHQREVIYSLNPEAPVEAAEEAPTREKANELSPDERAGKVLSLVRRHGRLTRGELQKKLGFSQSMTIRCLKLLCERGMLKQEGNARASYYVYVKDSDGSE